MYFEIEPFDNKGLLLFGIMLETTKKLSINSRAYMKVYSRNKGTTGLRNNPEVHHEHSYIRLHNFRYLLGRPIKPIMYEISPKVFKKPTDFIIRFLGGVDRIKGENVDINVTFYVKLFE